MQASADGATGDRGGDVWALNGHQNSIEVTNEMIAMREAGYSFGAIGDKYGISRQAVFMQLNGGSHQYQKKLWTREMERRQKGGDE